MKYNVYLFRFVAFIIGAILGLFFGLIILGTIIRVILDIMFHWGDSGPSWVNWSINIITAISIVITSYISMKWMNSFLKRKGYLS